MDKESKKYIKEMYSYLARLEVKFNEAYFTNNLPDASTYAKSLAMNWESISTFLDEQTKKKH